MTITELILGLPIFKWVLGTDEPSEPAPEQPVYGSKAEEKAFNDLLEHLITEDAKEGNTEDKPQRVVIENSKFSANRIKSYEGEKVKKFEFRPQTWEQFVGQTNSKEKIKTIMKKANRGIKAHLFIDGIKGHGKTTFIELLAKELNAKLIERVGKQIDEEDLLNIVNEINQSEEKHVILFIDEMDSMDKKLIKVLNPIIESFKINGKQIKPFIFAGATINKHILIKNNPDTLDRIPPSHQIKFERYDAKEIEVILRQYHRQLYRDEIINDETFKSISENCKFNPRTSISLLEDVIIEKNIEKVLKNCSIIKNGLTKVDIKLLKILNQSTRAMGANALSMRAGLSQKEYMTEFEPFLVEYNYIDRCPSRSITEKSKNLLKELK